MLLLPPMAPLLVAALDELVHADAGTVALAVTGVDGETARMRTRHPGLRLTSGLRSPGSGSRPM